MLQKLNILKWLRPSSRKQSASDLSDIFRGKYERFKELLISNTELSKIITDIEEKLQGQDIFGMSYVRSQSARAVFHTLRMIQSLEALASRKYPELLDVLGNLNAKIKEDLGKRKESPVTEWILPYSQITREMVDWVGGKSANLGEVRNRVNLPIPEGFAITTPAYEYFLSSNDLVDEINKKKMEIDPSNPEILNQVSEDIQRLIISAPVPPSLRDAILSAYDEMMARVEANSSPESFSRKVSMRSSAIGEDSDLSYAGQYLSVLNVPRERLIQTYTYIIASLFTPRAMAYRLNMGIRDEDVAMSVACLQMVESVASGVVYSRHPFKLLQDDVIISAVWGLGPYAVDGVITPDSARVSKNSDFTVLESKVSHKAVQLVCNIDGGLLEVPVVAERQDRPCLSEELTKLLAGYAIALETHYGCPQDIEWALEPGGRILILQTRPLRMETPDQAPVEKDIPELAHYKVLVENGAVAAPGIGYGKAHQVVSDEDLLDFPDDGVLIAKHSSPKFVVVMQKAQAIVTDSGSVTGHMASVSREFGVPTILDAKVATSTIPTGTEVTVDAYSGKVYEGKVPELLGLQKKRESHLKNTPVYESLRHVADSIIPLRLFDPRSPDFTPENCRSLHDIMRLVHEFSYQQMFQISDVVSEHGQCSVSLNARIPIDLCIIDLGGGLAGETKGIRRVRVDEVLCTPFKALLRGLTHKDLRYHHPRPVELGGFFSVMSEQMLSNSQSAERFGDRSYAIISDKYINFSSRVGYHYGILDSYCGQTMNKNYITFSFKGGAADDVRRNRRARSIALILKELDFTVEVMGDRVDARFQKYECAVIEEKLDILGRLLLFTRQLDMLMRNEASVEHIAKSFLEGNYHLD